MLDKNLAHKPNFLSFIKKEVEILTTLILWNDGNPLEYLESNE